jgi:hypothetical protein
MVHLPAPGEVEFVVLGGHRAQNGPALALAAMIRRNGDLLRDPRESHPQLTEASGRRSA